MAFKTIQTFVDGSEDSAGQLAAAIALCRTLDAHLSVTAIGYEPDIPSYAAADGAASVIADLIQQARAQAEALTKETDAELANAGVRGDVAPLTATRAGLANGFGSDARFADLVVLGTAYGKPSERATLSALEGALYDAGVPVLVCPEAAAKPFETALIAWNDDRHGLRAVRHALPFLTAAKTVEVAMIDPEPAETEPAERLAVYLSRHGVHVTTSTPQRGTGSVADALGRRVLDIGADLMVMGAYSHSRFREYVFGGVTRDVLHNPPVPVLMAHA